MNKSLFQIEQEYQLLTDQLIESEGELTPELEQALDIAQTELQTKGVAYSYIIKK